MDPDVCKMLHFENKAYSQKGITYKYIELNFAIYICLRACVCVCVCVCCIEKEACDQGLQN